MKQYLRENPSPNIKTTDMTNTILKWIKKREIFSFINTFSK